MYAQNEVEYALFTAWLSACPSHLTCDRDEKYLNHSNFLALNCILMVLITPDKLFITYIWSLDLTFSHKYDVSENTNMTTLSDFDVHLYTASDDVMEMDGALRNGSVVSGNGSVVSGNGSRLVDISGGNGSYDDEPVDVSPCSNQVPYSSELFRSKYSIQSCCTDI